MQRYKLPDCENPYCKKDKCKGCPKSKGKPDSYAEKRKAELRKRAIVTAVTQRVWWQSTGIHLRRNVELPATDAEDAFVKAGLGEKGKELGRAKFQDIKGTVDIVITTQERERKELGVQKRRFNQNYVDSAERAIAGIRNIPLGHTPQEIEARKDLVGTAEQILEKECLGLGCTPEEIEARKEVEEELLRKHYTGNNMSHREDTYNKPPENQTGNVPESFIKVL